MQEYIKWKKYKNLDKNLKKELDSLSEEEILEAFQQNLEFGTGGIRGIMGVGTNRLNIYTLRRANYGYGKYLINHFENPSVVIAYDNRHNSMLFAFESARMLGSMGIKAYLFQGITPTPTLSFGIRFLKASGGIVITASHNPPIYNGYKVYDQDGCQLIPKYADEVIEIANQLNDVFGVEVKSLVDLEKESLISFLDDSIYSAYLKEVKKVSLNPDLDKTNFKLVYTPLHGTGAILGRRLLIELGYEPICVDEQMIPDPKFSTIVSANPENIESFDLAIQYAKQYDADLCIATDPDADRIGLVFNDKKENTYTFLTGNQIGAIMINYMVNNQKDFSNMVMFNTIVTSDIGAEIAKSKGIEVISTLTGFRYVGEQIKLLENTKKSFFFGYEESYGYLVRDFVRDKDAFQSMVLLAEAVNYYKLKGKSLKDVLNEIYRTYGYYIDETINFIFKGLEGKNSIDKIMNHFRNNKYIVFSNKKVIIKEDYLKQIRYNKEEEAIHLPKSNVIKYYLEDGSWFALRPSGTEPKLKIYISVKSKDNNEGMRNFEYLKAVLIDIVNEVK